MQNKAPLGGQRGIVFGYFCAGSMLLTGIELRTSNTAKDEPAGPMGRNRGTSLSELKMAVPAASCVVMTIRGLELEDDMAKVMEEVQNTSIESSWE